MQEPQICSRVDGQIAKAADCDYCKCDRRLVKQFIYGLDSEGMISEILRQVSVLEEIDDGTSEWVLLWVQWVEAQRAQKEELDNIKEAKDFDSVGCDITSKMGEKLQVLQNGVPKRQCPTYGKTWGG